MSGEVDVRDTGFMAELPLEDRDLLVSWGETRSFDEGEVFIRQGQNQDTLYLLLSGQLEAERASDVSRVKLGRIRPGEAIGEMAVLDPVRASATIRAVVPGKAWSIHRPRFNQFLREHPAAGVKILRNIAIQMARRMRHASEQLIHSWENRFGFDEDY